MSTKKTKKPKQRSIHEMELAEIAWNTAMPDCWKRFCDLDTKLRSSWRKAICAVLEEAIYRVEAKIK